MDTYHLNPMSNCVLCGFELGDGEREIIRVESGELQVGEKSGRLCFFTDEDSTISFFHCDCVLTRMDFTKAGTRLENCGCCQTKLQQEPVVFRMMLGVIDGEEFVPFDDDENVALLCRECMLESMGEGDYEAGELILTSAAA
jgi:hypothetical protein